MLSRSQELSFKEKQKFDLAKRKKNFEESKLDTKNSRYGMFSYAPPFSYRDTTYNKAEPRAKEQFGPISFLPSFPKSGKGPDAYFSRPLLLSEGPYIDPSKGKHRKEYEAAKAVSKSHAGPFKPSGPINYKPTPHEFMPTQPIKKQIIKKDENGQLIIGKRNILTTIPKKGTSTSYDITIGKYPEYMSDDFEYARKMARNDLKIHHSKLQEQPFKPASLFGRNFDQNTNMYGGEFPEKKIKQLPQPIKAQHDRPFYPSSPPKKGIQDKTLQKFPEHKPDPIVQISRKEKNPDDRVWKRSNVALTTPSSPIVLSNLNIRKEFSGLTKLKL